MAFLLIVFKRPKDRLDPYSFGPDLLLHLEDAALIRPDQGWELPCCGFAVVTRPWRRIDEAKK
jgi:hypothetical protein